MHKLMIVGCVFVVLGAVGVAAQAQPAAQAAGSVAQNQGSTGTSAVSASVAGTITDPSGAVIVGASIRIHDSAGRDVAVFTDATGRYTASGLAPGLASVVVSVPGFTDSASTVAIAAAGNNTFDSTLQVQAGNTSVEVTTTRTTQVETENAEMSGTFSQEKIVGIGLNGRNFLSLLTLTPGVSNQTGQDEAKVGVVGSAKFSVNGGRTEYNTFDVDGNDVLNTDIAASHGHSTLLVYPSLDSIQELKVLTSNYGAQYGRSASGTVQVEIKSGAEKYHGNAYAFIRNEAFNSRNFFDAPGKAPLYRRQDFGFTVGGPLAVPHKVSTKPPKTFAFISEEWRKERTPVEFNQGVPSDAERGYNLLTQTYTNTADFSDVCPAPGLPYSPALYPDCPGTGNNGNYSPFPNNRFAIDPNASAILQTRLIPRANANSQCVSSIGSCYVGSVSPPTDYREDLIRVDHSFNDKWKLYGSGVHDHWQTTTAVPQWANYINSFPSVMNSFLGPGINGVVHLTTVINPSLLNDFSVGITRQKVVLTDLPGPGDGPGMGVSLDRSGLNGVSTDPLGAIFQNCAGGAHGPNNSCSGGKLPGLVFTGNNAEYGGAGFNVDTSYMPWFHTRYVGTITDNVSKFLKSHTLQFGGQLVMAKRHEFGGVNGANSGDVQGLLTFSNTSTGFSTGNAFADFLYYQPSQNSGGIPYSFQQDNTQTTYKVSYWTIEPYLQDNYKVTSRLTVNLGVRISLFQNWQPDGNVLYNWDPTKYDPNLMAANNLTINPTRGFLMNGNSDSPNATPLAFDGATVSPVLTNGLVRCGVNGLSASCQSSQLFNAAPRVGLAWDPTGSGKNSIRLGYGVFYEHGTGSEANVGSLMGNPPQVLSMTEYSPDGYLHVGLAGSGVGSVGTGNQNIRIETPLNMVSIPAKTIWPYVQQWSVGIQRELNRNTALSVAYVGSKGTHLSVAAQLNQLPPVPASQNPFGPNQPITQDLCHQSSYDLGNLNNPASNFFLNPNGVGTFASYQQNPAVFRALLAACDGTRAFNNYPAISIARNALRPYAGVGNVIGIRNSANSTYNSLQITAHHFNAPIDIAATLTYSHSIDSASDRFSSSFVDFYDLKANRAASDFDQRILINLNYLYPLPVLRAVEAVQNFFRRPATVTSPEEEVHPSKNGEDLSHVTKMIFANWSLSGVTLYQTGTPFSVINTASNNGVSMPDNAGLALDVGPDSYPDVIPLHGASCPTRSVDTGAIGPIIGNACQFVAPRGLTHGNAGRNYLRNPSRTNWDMSLLKDMKVWHGGAMQFRAEAFNVFNNTQFVIYDLNKGNTSSNTISCYGDETTGYSAGAATCDRGNGFLHPVSAHRPRTIQFGLKIQY